MSNRDDFVTQINQVPSAYMFFFFQRERVLKKRMKEKKLAKQKMANAEHKVRVATAFRGNRETDLELQVGDEVTVLSKVRDPTGRPIKGKGMSLPFGQRVFLCHSGGGGLPIADYAGRLRSKAVVILL